MSDWVTKQVDEVAELLDNRRVPVNEEERSARKGRIPYYGANGLQGFIDKPLFNEPLILLAEDGGNFDDFENRPIAYRVDGPSWVNNHAHVVRARPGTHQPFLFYVLEHKDIRRWIKGGTRGKLNGGDLRRVEVRLPVSVDEQRRIADLLSAVDAQIEASSSRATKLKATKAALAHQLLSTDSAGLPFPSMNLARLIERLESGVSVNAEDRPVAASAEQGVLKTSCVLGGTFLAHENKTIWKSDIFRARTSPKRGCIIISRMNTPDLVGECGLVDSDYPNLYLPDRLWQALPASTETSFGWLNECLQWEPVRKRVKDAATGTSNSMKNISKGAFLAIEVPVPPPDTQRSIAGALGALSQEIALEVAGVRKLTKLKRGLTFDLLGDKARAQ